MAPQAAGSETTTRTPAVTHAFAVLDALAGRSGGMRFGELVEELGVPKSSAHRLLATMCDLGATRKTRDGHFVIGPRMATYTEQLDDVHSRLIGAFYGLAEQIRDRQDETVQLAVLSGTDVMFIAYVDTTKPVRLHTRVGRHLPAHASASGKALLAFQDESALRVVLRTGLPRLTDATIGTEDEFRRVLGEVRQNGYAAEVEEMTSNLSCFAAPVLDRSGSAVAAVTACVPTNSVCAERAGTLVAEVKWAAEKLSA